MAIKTINDYIKDNNIELNKTYTTKQLQDLTWDKKQKQMLTRYQPKKKKKKGNFFTRSISTIGDVVTDIASAPVKLGRQTAKAIAGGTAQVADWLGADKWANKVRKNISDPNSEANKLLDDIDLIGKSNKVFESKSYLPEKADIVTESIGDILTFGAAGAVSGTAGAAAMFAPSAGEKLAETYAKGGNDVQAWSRAIGAGTISVITENLFGLFGKSGLDTAVANKISGKLTNGAAKILARQGIQATGEAAEEFLEYAGDQLLDLAVDSASKGKGAKFHEKWDWEQVGEQMAGAFISSSVFGAGQTALNVADVKSQTKQSVKESVNEYAKKIDASEGVLTKNEQAVVKTVARNKIRELLKAGKEITTKDIKKIESDAKTQLQEGNVSVKDIEGALNVKQYSKNYIQEEQKKAGRELTEEEKKIALEDAKESFRETLKNDYLIQESYNQEEKKGKNFSYDLDSEKNDFSKRTYESATKYLNDTNQAHKLADTMAKLSADTKVDYEFINNETLKKMGLNVDGLTVNGTQIDNPDGTRKVLINVDSNSGDLIKSIIGHETSHLFETSDDYKELRDLLYDYAKQKNDYYSKRNRVTEVYKDVQNANIDNELTADLLGEYLFTDEEFLNNLSTKKPTLFQKIKELIEDLIIRFKGTKEEQTLREMQKKFAKMYKTQDVSKKIDASSQKVVELKKQLEQEKQKNEVKKETKQEVKQKEENVLPIIEKVETKEKQVLPIKEETKKVEKKEIKKDQSKKVETKEKVELTAAEKQELEVLSDLPFDLSKVQEERLQYLKDKQNGNLKYSKLKNNTTYQDIKNVYNKYKNNMKDFNDATLKEAESFVPGYRNTNKRTKEQWLDVAEMVGKRGNFETSEELEKYAIQSWFKEQPNQKGNLNRQGQKFVKFGIEDWINSVYKGAGVGERIDNSIQYSLSQELDDYLNKNKFALDVNGNMNFENLTSKQITALASIYRKTGYSDVSSEYLKNKLSTFNGLKVPREVADRFIQQELGYKPKIDTTKVYEDAEGNSLTKEQVEFYKDSDVRDIRGRLIPVYHKTNAEFTVFDKKAGKQHGNKYGKGFYFSITPENYGNNEMKVYLNAKEGEYKYIPSQGYYVVQEANQIKAVDNETPTADADIRYSLSNNVPLENRVSGDELLDVQDLIEEIKSIGAKVDENGYVTLYHQTTEDNAQKIRETGKMISKEPSVYFSTSENASQAEGRGQTKLEFKIPAEKLQLDDIFSDNADVKINLNGKNSLDVSNYLVNDNQNKKYSLSTKDSQGRELSEQQQEYFKDSKVRDENGNLIVAHHGTDTDFNTFRHEFIGDDNKDGFGFYFTPNELKYDYDYKKSVYLDIKNPATTSEQIGEILRRQYELYDTIKNKEEVLKQIQKEFGVDGIIDSERNNIVVFNSNQIKNVDNTNPTDNSDIRYSLSQEGGEKLPTAAFGATAEDIKYQPMTEKKVKKVELPTSPAKTSQKAQKVAKTEADVLPLTKNNDVLMVEAENIADQINKTGDFEIKPRGWIDSIKKSQAIEDKGFLRGLDLDNSNYQVQTNQKSVDLANEYIERNGYDKSVAHAKEIIKSGKTPAASDVALLQRMTQEAIKNKDYQTAQELIMDTAILGTDLGQAVQAMSIIKKLTPEGQLKLYSKMVDRAKLRGEKAFRDVEITPQMVEKVLGAYNEDGTYDQDDLNARVVEFTKDIAEQMKSTFGDKANAWRYLSMLGNPKTHIRNMVSNVAMKETIKVKNAIARTLETILPVKDKTKTWKPASKDIKNFAKQTSYELKDAITGENKYNEKAALESEKQIFKNKTLEKLSRFNSNALEAEDWFFSRRAFEETFREYLVANGVNSIQDIENNPEIIEKGKIYAVEQAEIATFRQFSKLASEISRIERNNKAAKLAINAVLPFKKTPINVAKAGFNYSPLGLIKSVSYDAYQLQKGNINASQFIDRLSQGLTGTSVAMLGYALAKAGILTGSGGDDKEDKYKNQLGQQNYAVNIGGKSYSISWLSPVAMPLLVGSNLYEKLEEDKDWNADIIIDTLSKTLDPLSEMSFISGLTDTLKSYSTGGTDMIKSMGEAGAQSYILQFFPTLFSQMASTLDDKKRSTKVSNNSGFKFGEETMRKIMLKIPGLRNQLEVQTDIWGNEKEQSSNIIERAFENFIAPYSKTENTTIALDKEIQRVYDKTGETSVIPGIPQAYVRKDSETYKMSASEYTKYKETFGQTANNTLNDLINSNSYKTAEDEDKAKMIENVYKYAREQAKQEYFDSIKEDYTSKELPKVEKAEEKYGISAADYYGNKDEYSYANKNPERYLAIKAVGDYDTYETYKQDIKNIKDTYAGNENKNIRKQEIFNYINSLPISIEQKLILQKIGAGYSVKNESARLRRYIDSLDLSVEDKQAIDKVLFK